MKNNGGIKKKKYKIITAACGNSLANYDFKLKYLGFDKNIKDKTNKTPDGTAILNNERKWSRIIIQKY